MKSERPAGGYQYKRWPADNAGRAYPNNWGAGQPNDLK
jgi:hypothetical protein